MRGYARVMGSEIERDREKKRERKRETHTYSNITLTHTQTYETVIISSVSSCSIGFYNCIEQLGRVTKP